MRLKLYTLTRKAAHRQGQPWREMYDSPQLARMAVQGLTADMLGDWVTDTWWSADDDSEDWMINAHYLQTTEEALQRATVPEALI